MSKFKDSVVTEQGKALLFGTDKIIYTKAVLFSQDVSKMSVDDIRKLTKLDGDLLETPVGIHDRKDSAISIEASFSNHGLTKDIDFNAVGWFAKPDGGDEILVTVSPTDGTQSLGAQAPGQASDDAINLVMSTAVANSNNVTVTVDPAGQVTPAKLDSVINNFRTDITQVINDSTKVKDFPTNIRDLGDLPDGAYRLSNLTFTEVKAIGNLPHKAVLPVLPKEGYVRTITINDFSKIQIFRGPLNTIYFRTKNNMQWLGWTKIASESFLMDLQNRIAELNGSKADALNTYTKAEVDNAVKSASDKANQAVQSATAQLTAKANEAVKSVNGVKPDGNGNVAGNNFNAKTVISFDVVNKKPTYEQTTTSADGNFHRWLIDAGVLNQFADEINPKTIGGATDLNTFTAYGKYKLTNGGNTNTPPWLQDKRGQLLVFNYDNNAKTQIWIPVGSGAMGGDLGWRYWEGNNAPAWNRISSYRELQNVQNELNSKIEQAKNTANNALQRSGGTMNEHSTINWNGNGVIAARDGNIGGLSWSGATDYAKIYADNNGNDNLDLAFDLGDDGSNHFSFRNKGSEVAAIRSDGHFTGTVDWNKINGKPNDIGNATDVNNLKNTINNVVFSVLRGNIDSNEVRKYTGLSQFANGNWLVDQEVIQSIISSLKNLRGTNYFSNPNFNDMKTTGTYFISNPSTGNNAPEGSWGTLIVNNGYHDRWNRITQVYYPDNNWEPWYRVAVDNTWKPWQRLANTADLDNRINDVNNKINQLKDMMPQVQRFTDENQAKNWSNQGGNQLKIALL